MKLPGVLTNFFPKKPEPKQVVLSLLLDEDSVSAAAWSQEKKGAPTLIRTVTRSLKEDSWEARLKAADSAISVLDESVGATKIQNVVLGLPSNYLTQSGDIEKSVKGEIKHITTTLELNPIGFVSIHQAIAHTLKRDEGVPPTVILLGVNTKKLTITLYKVGALVGQKVTAWEPENVASEVEHVLKSFVELEILPSRILLYGIDHTILEEVQSKLLRFPWQTKANFLHFPKIEVLPTDFTVAAISVAGATELSQGMPVDQESAPPHVEEEKKSEPEKAIVEEEVLEKMTDEKQEDLEKSNVVMVEPESLGFAKEDILEKPTHEDQEEESVEPTHAKEKVTIPKLSIALPRLPHFGLVAIGAIFAIALIIFIFSYWILPKAEVTILVAPANAEESVLVTIEPSSSVVDPESKIIPGRTSQTSASGEKTIPVTGKKKVGDPAKGGITIFNKTTSSKSFKKGNILIAGGLQFTLDEDIQVASASENLVSGTVTFGKVSSGITATEIGTQSNLPAGTEFTFKDVSSSIVVVRNEKVLIGGTSRDVTVVSRADQDNLIKALTGELVEGAKQELAASVSGSEKLIDETIETKATEKSFTEELDQEATALHGKLTISISGISYSEEDIRSLLTSVLSTKIPQGYSLSVESLEGSIGEINVKKDGTITASASLKGNALPTINTTDIAQRITGKTLREAEEYLRSINGVSGVEFRFRYSLSKEKLPANNKNISVSVAIQ